MASESVVHCIRIWYWMQWNKHYGFGRKPQDWFNNRGLCWKQLVISHRQNLKGRIIANGKSQLMQLDSTLKVSGKTGAIHCELHPLGS